MTYIQETNMCRQVLDTLHTAVYVLHSCPSASTSYAHRSPRRKHSPCLKAMVTGVACWSMPSMPDGFAPIDLPTGADVVVILWRRRPQRPPELLGRAAPLTADHRLAGAAAGLALSTTAAAAAAASTGVNPEWPWACVSSSAPHSQPAHRQPGCPGQAAARHLLLLQGGGCVPQGVAQCRWGVVVESPGAKRDSKMGRGGKQLDTVCDVHAVCHVKCSRCARERGPHLRQSPRQPLLTCIH